LQKLLAWAFAKIIDVGVCKTYWRERLQKLLAQAFAKPISVGVCKTPLQT